MDGETEQNMFESWQQNDSNEEAETEQYVRMRFFSPQRSLLIMQIQQSPEVYWGHTRIFGTFGTTWGERLLNINFSVIIRETSHWGAAWAKNTVNFSTIIYKNSTMP